MTAGMAFLGGLHGLHGAAAAAAGAALACPAGDGEACGLDPRTEFELQTPLPWQTFADWPHHGGRQAGEQDPAAAVLAAIGQRLNTEIAETRGITPECQQKVRRIAEQLTNMRRHLPRHEIAEQRCVAEDMDVSKDGSLWKWNPRVQPLLDPYTGGVKSEATLAFSVLLAPLDDVKQVRRLLERLFWPGHAYVLRIDRRPETANADALADMAEALAKERGVWSSTFILRSIDVVYPGISLVDGDLAVWRTLLRQDIMPEGKNLPRWDFVINLSGSDYLLKSVPFVSRMLAAIGTASHVEAFFQTPEFSRARGLRDVFVECPSDPCRTSSGDAMQSDTCSGFIHWLTRAKKPPLVGSYDFGGSHWSVLHRDFVAHTLGCMDASDPSGIYHSDAYCASVRGFYDYFETNNDPDELFVPTALLNGPNCSAYRPGNLRWINWAQSKAIAKPTGRYPVKSPGLIDGELAKGIASSLGSRHIAARKMSLAEHPAAFDALDVLIAKKDRSIEKASKTWRN